MKKSTLNRLIVLAVAVCVLVGVSPLLKTITGLADVNANFIARINGNEQQSGDTFDEVITKSTVTNITSITMIAGEVSQTEFQYLIDNGLHTNLADLTTNTPPFTIDPTIFADFPAERKLHVPAAYLEQYKIVDDGDTTDNFWYGWSIMEATPPALVPASSVQEIQNPLGINMVAPAEGGTPTTTLDVGTGYTSVITWKNGETPHTDVFAPNTIYSAEVTLTSVEKFKFVPNASVSVDTGTVASMPVVTGEGSGNTLSFVVTFPNTTASNLAPPPTNDGILPPATEPTTPETPTPENPTPENPTPEAPTPEAPTPDVTSSDVSTPDVSTPDVSTPDVSTPDVSTPDNSSSDTSSVWKPTTMGGFRDTPTTMDLPMTMAAGVPEANPEPITATINAANRGTEIGDSVGFTASITGTSEPILPDPDTDDNYEYTDGELEDDGITPKKKIGTKTISAENVTTTYKYEYTWDEVVTSPVTGFTESPRIIGSVATRAEIPHFANNTLAKEHLGTHKFKFSVKETTTITGNTRTKYDPPQADPNFATNKTGITDVPFTSITDIKNATATDVDITVTKIKPTIEMFTPQPSANASENVDVSARVTGKQGVELYDTILSLSDTTPPLPANLAAYVQFSTTGANADQFFRVNNIFNATLTLRNEAMYTIKARYVGDANYLPAEITLTYDHKLQPATITSNHIGVISIPSPVAGEKVISGADVKLPEVPNTDGINYSLDLKWYVVNRTVANADFTDFSNDSLVANNFYEGKRHKAVITLKANRLYTFAPNTLATFQALGAIVSQPKYINSITDTRFNSENSIQYVILFPSTMSKDALDQKAFGFNNYAVPLTKTYGDPDFTIQAYGGNGTGNITYESSDPNVLRVMANPNGTASIKVVGSGKATISAKKAGSLEGDNAVWYEPVTAVTSEIVVAPKMLTASVDDKTIKVGSRTTAFNVRVRGFVNGDTVDNLAGYIPPIASADVEDVPILGTYDIKVSGGDATTKYTFKYVHGLLTVNETGIAPTTNNTSNTVVAGGNSAYIHEPRNDVTITRKDAQYFETGVNMSVEKQTSTISVAESEVVNRNVNAALPGKSTADIYNVSLSLDNEGYALNTEVSTQLKITTTIKNNYTDLGVVHIDAAGNIRSIPSSITSNGEYITFSTNYVGKFAIVGKLRVASADTGGTTTPPPPTTTYNPQTGDSTPTFPFIAAILLGCTLLITGSRKGDLI